MRLPLLLVTLAACGPVNAPSAPRARGGPLLLCLPGSEYSGDIAGLAIDPHGGFAIVGRFEKADFGDGMRGRRNGDDGYVARYDAAGNLFWVHTRERKRGTDRFNDVVIAPDGDVIAGGLTVSPDSLAAVVERLAPDGSVRWTAQLGDGYSSVQALALLPDGDLAIAGVHRRRMFVGRLAGDGTPVWHHVFGEDDDGRGEIDVAVDPAGDIVVAGHGGAAAFVVKHGAAGDTLWERSTELEIEPRAVAAGPGGRIYVAGDLGLAGFDAAGELRWVRSFSGRSVETHAIAVFAGGDLLVGGAFSRRIDLGGGALTASDDYDGPDGFAARYSADGEYRWSRRTELGGRHMYDSMRIFAVATGALGPLVAITPGPDAGSTHHLGCVASAESR